jgi:hypothetical protein
LRYTAAALFPHRTTVRSGRGRAGGARGRAVTGAADAAVLLLALESRWRLS